MNARRLSEKQFMMLVTKLARMLGWSVYHTFNSRRSASGYPDLTMAKPGHEVVFVELKSDVGQTTPEQDRWLKLLREAGAKVYLWRPEDLEKIPELLNAARIERTEDVRILD